MPKQSAAIVRVLAVLLFSGSLFAALPATPCLGDRGSDDATITLNVQNEPLRTVLERISKTTRWKIKAPDKWMDKPVTQTLNKVSLEEGLRFILKDAGVENLLLTYDEDRKTITVYDTEIQPSQSANRPSVQIDARPPGFSPNDHVDPVLKRSPQDAGSGPPRKPPRSRSRRHTGTEEEE